MSSHDGISFTVCVKPSSTFHHRLTTASHVFERCKFLFYLQKPLLTRHGYLTGLKIMTGELQLLGEIESAGAA